MNQLSKNRINEELSQNTEHFQVPYCFIADYKDYCYLNIIADVGIVSARPLRHQLGEIALNYYEDNIPMRETFELKLLNRVVPREHLNLILQYNQTLYQDLYRRTTRNSLNEQAGQRNYLFAPISTTELDIDYTLINNLIQRRRGNQFQETDPSETIYYGKQDICYVEGLFTEDQTIRELFNYFEEHSNITQKAILEFYQVSYNIIDKTIGYFVYDHKFPTNIDVINSLRSQKTRGPIALVSWMQNYKQRKYFPDNKFERRSLIKEPKLKRPLMNMMPLSLLFKYPLTLKQFEDYYKMPKILLMLEEQLLVHDASDFINIPANIYLWQAISLPTFNNKSYEALETLGDSILKYIVTLGIAMSDCTMNDSAITKLKGEIVSNDYLASHFYQNCGFIKHLLIEQPQHWISPLVDVTEGLVKSFQTLNTGFLADIFEALIGAAFMSNRNLFDSYGFLQQMRYPIAQTLCDHKYFPQVNLIQSELIPIETTFRELCHQEPIIDENLIHQIERTFGYYFNNKYILLEALNVHGEQPTWNIPLDFYFEALNHLNTPSERSLSVLELIGDAALECLAMTNIYPLIPNCQPTQMHKCKVNLLSNYCFGKLFTYFNLHRLLEQTSEIQNYVIMLDFDKPFNLYNSNRVKTPKVLADIFEAIAGAIVIDGGYTAFETVYTRVLGKFIVYCAQHIDKIENPCLSVINTYSTLQQGFFDLIQQSLKETHICEIRIHSQVVGRGEASTLVWAKEKAAYDACQRLNLPYA